MLAARMGSNAWSPRLGTEKRDGSDIVRLRRLSGSPDHRERTRPVFAFSVFVPFSVFELLVKAGRKSGKAEQVRESGTGPILGPGKRDRSDIVRLGRLGGSPDHRKRTRPVFGFRATATEPMGVDSAA